MNIDKKEYKKYANAHAPRSPIIKDCTHAFLVGGGICAFAEGLLTLYGSILGFSKENAGTLCSITLILIAVILTALGYFERIARFSGAGTLVPITGFANSVVSPAIDSKAEGLVLGIGAKIFTVAGPVLLYGTLAGTVWGVIYWITGLI